MLNIYYLLDLDLCTYIYQSILHCLYQCYLFFIVHLLIYFIEDFYIYRELVIDPIRLIQRFVGFKFNLVLLYFI